MISRSQLSQPRFFFSSLFFLLIFILSGCNQDSDTSDTPSPDPQTQDDTTPSGNQPPTAKITRSLVSTAGETVTLDGSSSSDPDGDTLSFRWEQLEGPDVTLSGVSTATLSFIAPKVLQATQFIFQLTVDDGNLSSTASVSFQLSPSGTSPDHHNQQPYAMITAPDTATSGQTVTLNGSGSSDPDGGTLSYQWTQTEGPSIALSNSSSSNFTFVAPEVTQTTQFTFQLTVNDGELSNIASVSLQISPMGGNTSPSIVSRSPQPDQSGVSTTAQISVRFDKALLESSVDSQSLLVSQNGSSVPGTVNYDSSNYTLTYKPTSDLSAGVTYTVTLAGTIKGISGNTFAGANWSFSTAAGTVVTDGTCATAEENNSLTLSCPSGEVITEIEFASYGNPDGVCHSFTRGSCNASNSVTVVSDACKGKNSCTLYAGSDPFGDPCEGAAKKLAAQVACGTDTDSDSSSDTNSDAFLDRDETELKAFPTAEGYGRYAEGGRGGRVIEVTNLNDSGPGSLRDAVMATGPRTVVFKVSGVINLKSKLVIKKENNHLTVAGQTAPGKGIVVHGWTFGMIGGEHVILRFIRTRVGTSSGVTMDGMGITGSLGPNIYDHVSISWTIDEGFSSRGTTEANFTLQRSMIAEALNEAGHDKYGDGAQHGYAASIGGDIGSFHHNLLAHNAGRNWSLAGALLHGTLTYAGRLDIRNNVVYNWKHRTTDGGAYQVNFVNNYYKPGPASEVFVALNAQNDGFEGGQWYYFSGNVMPGYFDESNQEDGRIATGKPRDYDPWVTEPFFESYVETQTAGEAYEDVLSNVGANRPVLDDHDARIIKETREGTYTYSGSKTGLPGLPDNEADVGGLEDYPEIERPDSWDSDHDGMPDEWETKHGLNPSDESDRNGTNLSKVGYTNLEMYLNEIAGDFD